MIGTVANFDAAIGIGNVASADGQSWMFHLTAISDGTRSIEAGAAVTFTVRAGGPGRWEAFDVEPIA